MAGVGLYNPRGILEIFLGVSTKKALLYRYLSVVSRYFLEESLRNGFVIAYRIVFFCGFFPKSKINVFIRLPTLKVIARLRVP